MLIGITGYKRSGKDSIADYLIKNYNFQKYSFALPLKLAICEIFGWDFNEVEKNENKEKIDYNYGISYRQACQDIGTEWGQYGLSERFPLFKEITGRKLWVKRFINFYSSAEPDTNIIIPDIRFPHEVDSILHLGGTIIKVSRDSINTNDLHESEQYIKDIKCTIELENNSTLEDLYFKVDKYMKELL